MERKLIIMSQAVTIKPEATGGDNVSYEYNYQFLPLEPNVDELHYDNIRIMLADMERSGVDFFVRQEEPTVLEGNVRQYNNLNFRVIMGKIFSVFDPVTRNVLVKLVQSDDPEAIDKGLYLKIDLKRVGGIELAQSPPPGLRDPYQAFMLCNDMPTKAVTRFFQIDEETLVANVSGLEASELSKVEDYKIIIYKYTGPPLNLTQLVPSNTAQGN